MVIDYDSNVLTTFNHSVHSKKMIKMDTPYICFLLVFAYIQIWEINSNEVYTVQATRVECNFNADIIKNSNCFLKLVRNRSNLININADFAYPQRSFLMRMTIFYRFNAGSYRFFLLNFTKNICKDVKWGEPNYKPDIELSMVFDAFKEYSDLIRPCPYQNNFTLKDLPANAIHFPPVVPAGDYRMDLSFYGHKPIAFVKVHATVKAKGLYSLRMG